MIEKHNGIWVDSLSFNQIIFENYDEVLDCLEIIEQTKENLYKTFLFTKEIDPQWSLPIWSEKVSGSLFSSLSDAKKHLAKIKNEKS